MKQYWLSLNQDTFVWTKEKRGLVYNTKNYEQLLFKNEGLLKEIVYNLQQIDNLYRITLDEISLADKQVQKWIKGLLSIQCVQLIENDGINKCPISLMPELKIQDSINYYKLKNNLKKGGDIMSNLHRLIFHLNGSEYGCNTYARQIPYPIKTDKSLSMEKIYNFINSSSEINYLHEVILIGCIWQYIEYERLITFLHSQNIPITVYYTENDFVEYSLKTETKPIFNIFHHVLISNYNQETNELINKKTDYNNLQFDFIITSEEDFSCANKLIKSNKLQSYHIYPVYTGKNRAFIEEYLYLDENIIKDIHLSKREIFSHQTLNTNFFGILTITPDGTVFSDKGFHKPIGNIDEGVYSIVYREITEGDSWFQIRNQGHCKNCIYQLLCPSPSTYEQILGKSDLCHIKHP